ncbi:MAG: hypothetical protein JXA28_01970 [Bacteroidetes bacterium]|nr:hypothetical protein [Bacteroidota bacterium]
MKSHTVLPVSAGGWGQTALLLFSIFLILGVVLAEPLFADSWPRERRTTFLRLGMRSTASDVYFNGSGERIALHRLEDQTYSLYSEYGYSRYVTAIVHIPAYRRLVAQEAPDGALNIVEAPGDIDLGLRVGIYAGEQDVILLTGMFGIPLGETANGNGLWSGDDEYDQLLSLGYAHSFAPFPAHTAVHAGYHFRSEGYSDEIHISGEIGIRPLSSLELLLRFRSVRSQENGVPDFIGGQYGFAANNQEYLMIGPEATFWITDGFGLVAALYSYSSAKNVPSNMAFTTGIVFHFNPSD